MSVVKGKPFITANSLTGASPTKNNTGMRLCLVDGQQLNA